jgi:Tfp pilus assembly protein PilN
MIRINLLGETATATEVRAPAGPPLPVASLALTFGASLVVALGVVGILGWAWSRQVDALHHQLAKEQAEQTRLAAVAAENKRYEQQIVEVEARIKTIQALEEARTGPVDLMNSLAGSVNLANDLYLLSVKVDGGRLILKGETGSVNSIADFIAALKREGDFYDVHLQQYYQDDENDRMNFKFDLDCVYSRGGPPALPPASTSTTATTVRGKA